MVTETQWTEDLGRNVLLRPDTADRQVWSDTYVGRYHIPPKRMPPPARVLDLGSNIGLTCAHYNMLWPESHVVGVEMDERCALLARVNAPDSIIENYAVASRDSLGNYDTNARSDAFSLASGGTGVVRTKTFAHTITRAFSGEIADFTKMDIEGSEWDVFAGPDDWVPLVKHLLVELHGDGGSAALLERGIRELTRLGFEAVHHKRHPQAVYAWR